MIVALLEFVLALVAATFGVASLLGGVPKPHDIANAVAAFIASIGLFVWCYGSILKAWGH